MTPRTPNVIQYMLHTDSILLTGLFLLPKLIGRPLTFNADGTTFFRPFWHHCQMLIWLAARIVVQSFDLARVALHGDIIEAADRQAPARVRCCNKTSL
jgi:hypothetical protein